jgi:hypothetical protein
MEHLLSRTVGLAHSAAPRRSVLAALAVVASAGVIGCGSRSTDTAKATAVFRKIVERQYEVTAGRCARTAPTRWNCTARIDDPAMEIDVAVHDTVWSNDGRWNASGSQAARGGYGSISEATRAQLLCPMASCIVAIEGLSTRSGDIVVTTAECLVRTRCA